MCGRLITFEGTEGAGKSTQIRLVAERLRECGREVEAVWEPGGTPAGERIRDVLKDPDLAGLLSPESELLLVSASRVELVRQVIRPALEDGKIVLCDRYIDSTVAYQGYGRGLDRAKVASIIDYSISGIRPDATIFIDIPLEMSRSRRAARSSSAEPGSKDHGTDRFEQSGDAFFSRVEAGFRELASQEPNRIHVVDGQGTVDQVAERIWESLKAANLGF